MRRQNDIPKRLIWIPLLILVGAVMLLLRRFLLHEFGGFIADNLLTGWFSYGVLSMFGMLFRLFKALLVVAAVYGIVRRVRNK